MMPAYPTLKILEKSGQAYGKMKISKMLEIPMSLAPSCPLVVPFK